MTPDNELLRQYTQTGSEEAFAELVRRHVNLVYSAALRQVNGDAHLAHDVAQSVFTDLARKAGSLSRRESLSGWLYTSAYFAAGKIVRMEHRRREREEQFMREPIDDNAPATDWEKLRSALDAVMHELKETDREAVLLRYFENRAFTEVGAKLGVNENTARMRVERALEKLRGLLGKRGVTTATALASIISANAIQTAPTNLAATIITGSLAAVAGGITLAKMMTLPKLKLGLGTLATAGIIGTLVIQHRALEMLRNENESSRRQITRLQTEADTASHLVAMTNDSAKLSPEEFSELLKLRAEVTQLRAAKDTEAALTPPESAANDSTNTSKMSILLRAKFVSLPSAEVENLRPAWAAPANGIGVLTGGQIKFINEALQRGQDIRILGSPRIQTHDGIQSAVSITANFPIAGTNATIGTILDVTPHFPPDASVFNLDLAVRLSQLTGDPSQPDVQTTQITNQTTLLPGQTVLLQKEIPAGCWTPDSTHTPDGPRSLLVFVTPEIVDESQKTGTPQNEAITKDAAVMKLNNARQGAMALLLFADKNQDQFPTNLTQVSQFLPDDGMKKIASDFDLVLPPWITNIVKPSEMIVLREKQAWLGPNGNWSKSYGFADGHAEIHSEPSANFDDFEKDRIVPPPLNQ